MLLRGLLIVLLLVFGGQAAELEVWQTKALDDLCSRYAVAQDGVEDLRERLDQVAVKLGAKLAAAGLASVPAEDLAMLALLDARLARAFPPASGAAPAAPEPPAPQAMPTAQAASSDLRRGEEGLRRAQEELAKLPLSERLVITGDVVSAIQAAIDPGSTDMTSTSGRVRVNFVLRAMSGQNRRGLGDGYFFVQMLAAGGAPDASVVGGPASFTALNDAATDRSRFNEATTRGNLYLSKVFYQQSLDLGRDRLTGRVGILDLTDYFDASLFANNEARQFLNGAFVNSAAFKTGVSAPGLVGEYERPLKRPSVESLVVRAGYAITRTERAFTSPLWTGEGEIRTQWKGLRGYWRLGGAVGNRAGFGTVRNVYLSADHWVAPRIGIFGRYAIANSGPGSLSYGPVRQSYSGGVQVRRPSAGNRISAWFGRILAGFPGPRIWHAC